MSDQRVIYLDNNATTRADVRVVEAMIPYFICEYGDASSTHHRFGWRARAAVGDARAQVARAVGAASPDEIIFTSGATESVNLALKGVVAPRARAGLRPQVITALTEHKAVLDTLRGLELRGVEVTRLPVMPDGLIDLDALGGAFTARTVLVTIMAANNETGVIPDLSAIALLCRERGVPLHTDATQALGKIPFDVEAVGVDLASFSAHKLYGPKGVGGLYVRRSSFGLGGLVARIEGGGHKRGHRSGTPNVPAIVGMGEALEIALEELPSEARRLGMLRERLLTSIRERLDGLTVLGHAARRLPGTLNLRFDDVESEALMYAAPELAVSAGSACSSGGAEASHVLRAMGLDDQGARSCVRFSIGRFNSVEDIDLAASISIEAVRDLRSASPTRGKRAGEIAGHVSGI